MARDESTKSKLIKLLQQVSRGTAPRMGLIPTSQVSVPAMALVVSLEQANTQAIAAAAKADAVSVPVSALSSWQELKTAMADKPLGLFISSGDPLSADDLKRYHETAPDFIIASAGAAPATFLTWKEIGKIVSVDETYPAQLVRALGEMSVDAVLAEPAADGGGPLTVRDLLHYRQTVDLVRRPVMVVAEQRLTAELLSPLRDMGVEALVLRVPAATKPDQLKTMIEGYCKDIADLGKSIGRAREGGREAIVPRIAPSRAIAPEPEEEPDDE